MLAPFDHGTGGENPYTIQHELQDTMHNLVGIIRNEDELKQAITDIGRYRVRAERAGVEGHRQYNPGWHLAMDLKSMLTVSEAVARAAALRHESRGGHTRDDYPATDPEWGKSMLVVRQAGDGQMEVNPQPLPQMPDELQLLLGEGH
jgi:succinate dehydrogenase / fumarate reductase flavoprotein subunit